MRITFKKYPTDRVIGSSRNTEVRKYINLEYTLNYKSCIMCANIVKKHIICAPHYPFREYNVSTYIMSCKKP